MQLCPETPGGVQPAACGLRGAQGGYERGPMQNRTFT